MEKSFSFLDLWGGCPNDGAEGHLKIHFASRFSDDVPWILRGGRLECPIPENADLDSDWALIQEWTGRP